MASISGKQDPVVLPVTVSDIAEALAQGMRDFQAAPRFGLLFGGAYALGGIAIVLCLTALGMTYFAYPLGTGFALVGPFVAAGLYEVSRTLERGGKPTLPAIWRTVRSRGEVGWMAFVTVFILVMWMYQVRFLMALFLGINASFSTLSEFLTVVLTTTEGLLFLAVGNVVGALLSLVLFSVTVISFPLVLDRDVDIVTAMVTSIRVVTLSPVAMLGWGAVVVALLILSALPFFIGLVVTLPVLGHATWHLYRRAVAPEALAAAAA